MSVVGESHLAKIVWTWLLSKINVFLTLRFSTTKTTQRIIITFFNQWCSFEFFLTMKAFFMSQHTLLHDDLNTDFSLHSPLRTFTMIYAIVILCLNVSFAELSKQLFFQLLSLQHCYLVVLYCSIIHITFFVCREWEWKTHTTICDCDTVSRRWEWVYSNPHFISLPYHKLNSFLLNSTSCRFHLRRTKNCEPIYSRNHHNYGSWRRICI